MQISICLKYFLPKTSLICIVSTMFWFFLNIVKNIKVNVFFKTSPKNDIVKNWKTSLREKHRIVKKSKHRPPLVPVMNSLCSCHQPSQHLTHSSVAGDEHNLQSLRRKLESNLCLVEVQMDFFPLGLTVLGNFRHFSVDAGLKAQQVFCDFISDNSELKILLELHLRDKVGHGDDSQKKACHHWSWCLPG